jgi:hypothetical protein
MRHLTKRGPRLNRLWKEIETHSHKYRTREPIKIDGRIVGWKVEVFPRYKDPSLRDQLYARADLREGEQMRAYLQATQMEPYASKDTKRKWRRSIGL